MKLVDKHSEVKYQISLDTVEVRDIISALDCLGSRMTGSESHSLRIAVLRNQFEKLI